MPTNFEAAIDWYRGPIVCMKQLCARFPYLQSLDFHWNQHGMTVTHPSKQWASFTNIFNWYWDKDM